MVQHICWDSREFEIDAPRFTQKFTVDSQIHDNVKFARISYEFRTNLPSFPLFRFVTALKAFLRILF